MVLAPLPSPQDFQKEELPLILLVGEQPLLEVKPQIFSCGFNFLMLISLLANPLRTGMVNSLRVFTSVPEESSEKIHAKATVVVAYSSHPMFKIQLMLKLSV